MKILTLTVIILLGVCGFIFLKYTVEPWAIDLMKEGLAAVSNKQH